MDPQLIEKLLEGLRHISGRTKIRSMTACVDEKEIWAFLDSPTVDENSSFYAHVAGCGLCLGRLTEAMRLDANTSLTAVEESFLDATPPFFGGGSSISSNPAIRIIDLHLAASNLSLRSTNLATAEGYRSDASNGLQMVEAFGEIELQIEFKKIVDQMKFEIFIEITKSNGLAPVSIELWNEAGIVRALSLDADKKQTLSRWPAGSYRIVLKKGDREEHSVALRVS